MAEKSKSSVSTRTKAEAKKSQEEAAQKKKDGLNDKVAEYFETNPKVKAVYTNGFRLFANKALAESSAKSMKGTFKEYTNPNLETK